MFSVSVITDMASQGFGQRVGTGPFGFLFGADTVLPLVGRLCSFHALSFAVIVVAAFFATRAEKRMVGEQRSAVQSATA